MNCMVVSFDCEIQNLVLMHACKFLIYIVGKFQMHGQVHQAYVVLHKVRLVCCACGSMLGIFSITWENDILDGLY